MDCTITSTRIFIANATIKRDTNECLRNTGNQSLDFIITPIGASIVNTTIKKYTNRGLKSTDN